MGMSSLIARKTLLERGGWVGRFPSPSVAMLFTLFASELLLIIPGLIDRFTSHVTIVVNALDVSTPDR